MMTMKLVTRDVKRGQRLEAKAEAEARASRPRPRPKFWPRDRFGLKALTSLLVTKHRLTVFHLA